jgi:hypothetical protein
LEKLELPTAGYFFGRGVINVADRLHPFSYMRGIDGDIDEGKGGQDHSGDKKVDDKAEKKSSSSAELEKASCLPQFDYIRRLAEQVYAFWELGGHGNSGDIIQIKS